MGKKKKKKTTTSTTTAWFNSSYVCPEDDRSNKPFSIASTYLSDNNCLLPSSWDDWNLKDGVFDCGDIPDCPTSCSGPSAELLKEVTEQCGCSAVCFDAHFNDIYTCV
jgi:hypothetical protein